MAEIDDQVAGDQQPSAEDGSVDLQESPQSETLGEETSESEPQPETEEVEESAVAEDSSKKEDSPSSENVEEVIEPEEVVEPEETGEKKEWFVLKVASNREKSVRNALLRRIKQEGLEEFFGEILIPTEKVAETKGGKKRVTEVKLFPGYIMINLVLNDDTWYLVRDTNGVGDFTGAAGRPLPMSDDEIAKMLRQEEATDEKEVRHKINMTVGETVKITEGPFESFEGTVDAIDEEHGKVTVLVEIFGQSTPVELEHGQMEKV